MLAPDRYLAALRADGDALAYAAAGVLDRPVPCCPGWTGADLVGHVGEVHRRRGAVVRAGGTERPQPVAIDLPPRQALLGWYLAGLHDLVAVLTAVDPQQPTWSFATDQRAAFWQRRMAHETAIHRWDAQAAAGAPQPIAPADFAADGVDEVLTVFAAGQVTDEPYDGPPGTIHVHATDADGEWVVELAPPALTIRAGHERADAALRGPASDLDLVLWKRLPPDTVERFGDPALIDGFLAWIDHT